MRSVQMKKRGGGKTEEQKAKRHLQVVEAHQQLIDTALAYLNKARLSLVSLNKMGLLGITESLCETEVQQYMTDAE